VASSGISRPRTLLGPLGFAPLAEPFFAVQGGVFHLLMALAYGWAATDLDDHRELIRFAVVVESIAALFLIVYWFAAAGRYRLFCLARRSRRAAGVFDHENMRWSQVDIASRDTLREVINCVKSHGGACVVLHLAGYYDFHNMEHPEYERTNVLGTQNVLKLAGLLGTDRFIFASSLAACEFPRGDEVIDESNECEATFAFARSKRQGEEMVREHVEWFPGTIVRMAAMYSDWCEYPPLYMFPRTWLGDGWNNRILGGKGESAVPYLHVADLVRLFLTVIEKRHELPRLAVHNASPDHCTTHRDLYAAATRDFYGAAPPLRTTRGARGSRAAGPRAGGHLRRKPVRGEPARAGAGPRVSRQSLAPSRRTPRPGCDRSRTGRPRGRTTRCTRSGRRGWR
jgi:nucleoside-diphosphate-sugar epimerase